MTTMMWLMWLVKVTAIVPPLKRRLEVALVRRALRATKGYVRAASALLGVPERTVWRLGSLE